MNAPDATPKPAASGAAGQRLAAARIEWGVSVSEVAAHLNLSDAAIEALEAGAHDKLPGLTFVKGYLRAYAKLLNLDPDEIIAHAGFAPEAFNEIPVAHVPLQRAGRGPRIHRAGREGKHRFIYAAVAAVAVLTLALAALWLTPNAAKTRLLQALNLSTTTVEDNEPIALPADTTDPTVEVDAGFNTITDDTEEDNALIIEEE